MTDATRGALGDTAPAGDVSHAGAVQSAREGGRLSRGTVLAGRYRIEAFIARGGMGEVYEALDVTLGARIAIKVLLEGGGDGAERREARLRRELVLARKVTHRHVCRVFGVEHEPAGEEGRPALVFVTMELLRGETLASLIGSGALAPAAALPIVEQLAAGLDAAHTAGVIHRDFKPHNVILVDEPAGRRAVITDFGLARTIDGAATTTDFAGTPVYMAPEQVLDEPVTPATDVYALGVTMFELVTGTRPFDGATPLVIAMRRVDEPAPRASTRVRDLDAIWDATIARCLAREPGERFASAGAVVASLRGSIPVAIARRRWSRRQLIAGAMLAALVAGAGHAVVRTTASPPEADTGSFVRHGAGEVAALATLGASDGAEIQRLELAADGDLVVAGYAVGDLGFGGQRVATRPGVRNTFVARMAPTGRVRWVRVFEDHLAVSTALALDGERDRVVVAGTREISGARETCFAAALDANDGALRWMTDVIPEAAIAKTIGTAAVVADRDAAYVACTTGGRAVIAAYGAASAPRWRREVATAVFPGTLGIAAHARRLAFVVTTPGPRASYGVLASGDGTPGWTRELAGDTVGHAIASLGDGRLAIAGSHRDLEAGGVHHRAAGLRDAFVVVTSPGGEVTRVWTGGSPGSDEVTDIAVDGDHLLVGGRVQPGFTLSGLPVIDAARAIILRLAIDGASVDAMAYGAETTTLRTVRPGRDGTLLVGGVYRYELPIGAHTLASRGTYDGYLAELRPPWSGR